MSGTGKQTELQAVLVCPDRTLAQQFSNIVAELKTLSIVADLKEYPAPPALDQRLGQLRPDVVALEVGSDRTTALALISHVAAAHSGLSVIGLHSSNDSEIILQCLRGGVAEFLYAPFKEAEAEQAIMRLVRRKESGGRQAHSRGKLIAFVPAKGGSGATTLAANVAHRISRLSQKRVLLADFDLAAGTVGFLFKLSHTYSLLDAIQHSHQLDESLWGSLIVSLGALDVLPSPEKPYNPQLEAYRVHECLEYARSRYQCVVVDLSSIAERLSLATLKEADQVFLVSNPELPTLFLARKTLAVLEDLGFRKEQVRVLVNRLDKREELSLGDMEKIFRFPIYATFPNDNFSIRRALTEGKPVADNCDLGAAFRKFCEGLFASAAGARRKGSVAGLKTLFSEG